MNVVKNVAWDSACHILILIIAILRSGLDYSCNYPNWALAHQAWACWPQAKLWERARGQLAIVYQPAFGLHRGREPEGSLLYTNTSIATCLRAPLWEGFVSNIANKKKT